MLNLVNISKTYETSDVRTVALNQVYLQINAGEYVAITGPSGCGKSTLLSMLGMLDRPNAGEYWFEGQNLASLNESKLNRLRRGRVGFIFQNFNLLEELSVAENVELALEYGDLPVKQRRDRAAEMLDRLGVGHRGQHRPSQLSGGQQQRVAIARALVSAPAILLADEPTGNLDTAHGNDVMGLLKQINEDGTTVVMVTHSPEHAAQAGRVLHMLDGRILSDTRQAASSPVKTTR
jgi:putative ABC transport system ATP-binding protein